MHPVLAVGDERAALAAVLRARSRNLPLIVPPEGIAEAPGLTVARGQMVAFTSGSTGTQRGILRTHASWTASLDPLTGLLDLQAGDRICVRGSVRATMGLYGAVHAMHALGEVILADEPCERATIAHAVPMAARDLLAEPPPNLRLIVVAGDRVPADLVVQADRRGIALLEYYGATELSFVAYRRSDVDAPGLAAFPGVQLRIEDGVIWARSDYLAQGYVGSAGGPGRWQDGWATVGDRGWLHHDQLHQDRLMIEGRGDEAITVGGHSVHLADVEDALLQRLADPGGPDADRVELAVLGQEHVDLGQVPVAVIAGGPALVQRAREAARALPAPARPRRWIAVGKLPRTPAGKVDRAALLRLVQDA